MSFFDDFLEFGKQKEVTSGQIWRVGWLLQYSNVIFGKYTLTAFLKQSRYFSNTPGMINLN